MSDIALGPGWWIASDGKWYPPELHPDARATVREAVTTVAVAPQALPSHDVSAVPEVAPVPSSVATDQPARAMAGTGTTGSALTQSSVDAQKPDHGRWDHSSRSTKGGPTIPNLFAQAVASEALSKSAADRGGSSRRGGKR